MPTILALDLATHTGWALGWETARESGVQVFDVKRGESPGMRYVRFRRWLVDLVFSHLPEGMAELEDVALIVYEQAHQRGGAATEVAAGFTTRVQEFCAEHGLEHAAVHSGTLKKYATGKGNAKKPDMLAAARTKLGYAGSDDNEADALWLLQYARTALVT